MGHALSSKLKNLGIMNKNAKESNKQSPCTKGYL
jgi:hypothetical protein